MELIDLHTKRIMEGCKERAREAGLSFSSESLEYIVTNRDLIELSPKVMIPTLYDYWVHDVRVLSGKGSYELYPSNPYETVINTHPPISFYNDNNPDWLNVMIFYHVLGHIDFFQNNVYYGHTWDDDFNGQALSDKRLIAGLRAKKGRWVDYVIEFTRGIDNLAGYYDELNNYKSGVLTTPVTKIDYYFDVFLQTEHKIKISEFISEVERYNKCERENSEMFEDAFMKDVRKKYPEFENLYKKMLDKDLPKKMDLIQYIMENSSFLSHEENKWMKSVMEVVRKTSIYFQPQIRTKIMNEGWASYWHEYLFLKDDRICGHEIDFARVNASVTSMPRVGLNPYALGMRLFQYIEEMEEKGKYSRKFQKIFDSNKREKYNQSTNNGRKFIFEVRKNLCDSIFINRFIDQDFVTNNKLFVTGKRVNQQKGVMEYYVKSRKAKDYKEMVLETLYHPPVIEVQEDKSNDTILYLNHFFEGKPLVEEYITNTMLGIEYLWGGPVKLETSEVAPRVSAVPRSSIPGLPIPLPIKVADSGKQEIKWRRVLYTMKNRSISKMVLR
ncbi:MAG: SpoVR family protein [Desulfobacteraceae bacterium 4572_19]|nr:MAG: SpoVR family protein [Desulfobacteraceae bacterium 4572_19]